MDQTIASVEQILADAVEIATPADRQAFVEKACAGNADLRAQVQRLLANHDRAGSFLEHPAAVLAPTDCPAEFDLSGTQLGPYKLLEQIGEGGMGVVYVAEQTQPVRRTVALKLIKAGMDSKQVIARFEAERHALALMDHPNIAKVLDAGTTDAGRHYFVMELVRGIAISEYCDQARLTVRQRLELFIQVCRAVQHAHTKGIIHRDLKPSNVLVTSHDGVPVPMIIDFGVAKALERPLTEASVYTGFAQMIGTPLYMSPEQAEFNQLGVDTRSDIYSLGVMLYELLTGATPFDQDRLRTVGLEELRRILREEEPPRPSVRLSTLGAAGTTASERRGVDPRKLRESLYGELDWIVLKALEKDRTRRYETASAFAADVQRYLNDEQVEACPPSAVYRLRKFARRNKVALATTGLVAAALLIGTAFSLWQAIEATTARELADKRLLDEKQARRDAEKHRKQAETDRTLAQVDRKKAEAAERKAATEAAIVFAVNEFFHSDVLGQVASAPHGGQELKGNPYLTVKEALDRAASHIGQRFKGQPLVEAAIRTTIGQAYNSLVEHESAVAHLERAVALRRMHLGPDHVDTFQSMQYLAQAYLWVGRHSDAISLYERILENRTTLLGADHAETLTCLNEIAAVHSHAGEWDKSVRLLESMLKKRQAIWGLEHPETVGTMLSLGQSYTNLDRFAESLLLHEKVLEFHESTYGSKHEATIFCMLSYAYVSQQAGKLDQAERVLREALGHCRNRDESWSRRIQTANTVGWLARTLLLQERYRDAEPLAREAAAVYEKERPHDQRRFFWVSLLGCVLLGQEKYVEAEPLLLQGYQGMKQREAILPANEKRRLQETVERVVHLYGVTGQQEKARAWREKLPRN